MLKAWLRDESGQAMAEYGLLIALVVVGVAALAITFRNKIAEVLGDATSKLSTGACTTDVNGVVTCPK